VTGRTRAALALVLALPLALAACGKRGPPVAPERKQPAAVADLSAAVTGDGVRLRFTLPRVRADRSPVKELRRAEVYRRLEIEDESAPSRPAVLSFGGLFGGLTQLPGFDRVADILLAQSESERPPGVQVTGNQVAYTDSRGLVVGRRYTYVVVAVDAQGRPSPPSNRIAVAMAAPPEAPTGLAAEPGDREVHLTWSAPERRIDGSAIDAGLLYNVFRGATADARPARPLNPEPLATPDYTDIGLQNEATYYYSVQALVAPAGPSSRPTAAVAATPEDTTPPAQPRGLVAVAAGTGIRLAWEAVGDADVAGYRIYRSTTAGRGYQPLLPALSSSTTYVDSDVRAGQTYYYVVTAVDRARRANESVPSAEASARLP
jgi:fibronectin type 3 domain-containing protein/predicted small lipoprotein YifL